MPSTGEILVVSGVDRMVGVGELGISVDMEIGVSSTTTVGIAVKVGTASGVD